MSIISNFRTIASFTESHVVLKFWLVTVARLFSSLLDILALALIWYSVNSVMSGYFEELTILNLTVVAEQPISESLAAFFGIATLALFASRSAFGLLTLRSLLRVTIQFEHQIAKTIIRSALSEDLGGGDRGREALPVVQHALHSNRLWVAGSVKGLSILVSEGGLIVILLITMMATDFISTSLLLLSLGLSAVGLQAFMGSRVRSASRRERDANARWLSDLSGALSVKMHLALGNKVDEWLTGISQRVKKSADANASFFLLNSLPRYVLEIAAIFAVGLIVGASFLVGEFSANAADASLVLAGAFRISAALLPLQTAINSIQNGMVMKRPVLASLETAKIRRISVATEETLLAAVDSLIEENKSKYLLIHGDSGVGKTTSVLNVLQLMRSRPQSGFIRIGYGGQDPAVLPGGLSRNIFLKYDKQKIKLAPELINIAEELGLSEQLERLAGNEGEGNLAESMSGGEQTRLEILRAHAEQPYLVFLDEPTTGLDNETIKRLSRVLRDSSSKYVIVTHDEEFASMLEDVVRYKFE